MGDREAADQAIERAASLADRSELETLAEQLLTPLLDHPPDDSFRCFLMVALVIGELP